MRGLTRSGPCRRNAVGRPEPEATTCEVSVNLVRRAEASQIQRDGTNFEEKGQARCVVRHAGSVTLLAPRAGGESPGTSSELVVRGRVELPTFRFSGECPGPHESTAVCLIRPDDLIGHFGVQDRPHVSTAVVSTALAAGPLYPVTPDLPLLGRGVRLAVARVGCCTPLLYG